MGIFDRLRGELIDIIEWLDDTNDTIVYRFERYNNEIKMGAQLTVRPGQMAVFVNEGQVADVFLTPGKYELSTQNLPLLSTLKGWKYGFNSPFKAEVYFFSAKVFNNIKWGTANPITMRDPELGPIRVRAFGSCSIRVSDPTQLLQDLVSTDGLFQLEEIQDHLRNVLVNGFTSWLGKAQIPLLDLAAHYGDLGERLANDLKPELHKLGIELVQILIENVSLPPKVEEALDKRSSMGLLGNMQQYTQYQAANAIETAAQNPGGGSDAMNMGLGMAMGQQMMNAMNPPGQPAPPPQPGYGAPPPPPMAGPWHLSKNGQQLGPFTVQQLTQQGLTPQTMVWKNGMANWQAAGEIPELQSALPAISPPPPPMAAPVQWYLAKDGQQVGPFSGEQLPAQGLTPSTMVWSKGMDGWQAAGEVAALGDLFNDAPPPPPL